jgi:hypothetical protein
MEVEISRSEVALVDRRRVGGDHADLAAPASRASGRPVFVSDRNRRAVALRALGCVVGAVTVLWLAALIAGALGVGRLPAVPFPAVGALDDTPAADHVRRPAAPRSAPSAGIAERGFASERLTAGDRLGRRGPAAGGRPGARDAPRGGSRDAPAAGGDLRSPGSSAPAAGRPDGGTADPAPAGSQPDTPAPGAAVAAPVAPAKGGASRSPLVEPPASTRPEAPPASPPAEPAVGTPGAAHRPLED